VLTFWPYVWQLDLGHTYDEHLVLALKLGVRISIWIRDMGCYREAGGGCQGAERLVIGAEGAPETSLDANQVCEGETGDAMPSRSLSCQTDYRRRFPELLHHRRKDNQSWRTTGASTMPSPSLKTRSSPPWERAAISAHPSNPRWGCSFPPLRFALSSFTSRAPERSGRPTPASSEGGTSMSSSALPLP
jgi:hypothetical protein